MIGKDLVQTVLIGGYPEMLRREDPQRRQTWARDYIRAIVQRMYAELPIWKSLTNAAPAAGSRAVLWLRQCLDCEHDSIFVVFGAPWRT